MQVTIRGTALLLASLLLAACDSGPATPAITAEQMLQLRERSAAHAGRDAQQLQGDSTALALGGELFVAHCSSCHDGKSSGRNKATDLQQGIFNFGDSAEAIRTTITSGRHNVMPAFGGTLGEVELGAIVARVRGFSLGNEPATFATTAAAIFEQQCQSCHGTDGKGNAALGVPDLTDHYWQHGGEMMNVRITITRGIEAACPAQAGNLTAAEIELLTAWVLDLRRQP